MLINSAARVSLVVACLYLHLIKLYKNQLTISDLLPVFTNIVSYRSHNATLTSAAYRALYVRMNFYQFKQCGNTFDNR